LNTPASTMKGELAGSGGSEEVSRRPGKKCVDCGAGMHPYGERIRCYLCQSHRSRAMEAVGKLWNLAERRLAVKKKGADMGRIYRKMIALSLGMMQSRNFGYRGDPYEILELFPIEGRKALRHWDKLTSSGIIHHAGDPDSTGIFYLTGLPESVRDDWMFLSGLKSASLPPEPRKLIDMYLAADFDELDRREEVAYLDEKLKDAQIERAAQETLPAFGATSGASVVVKRAAAKTTTIEGNSP
jgi:hypothetical protein